MSFFITNEGLVKLRKKYGHFSKWFLAEGRFPATSGFWGSPIFNHRYEQWLIINY